MSASVWLDNLQGFKQIDLLAKKRIPFLFVISFDAQKIFAKPLKSLDKEIYYKLGDWRNYPAEKLARNVSFCASPIDFAHYKKTLEQIQEEIRKGNTYLLNLTFKTPIETDLTLREIFTCAKAKFKLYFKDEFVCFSPEPFIEIKDNLIATYPMKGTIDADLPDAASTILNDAKEMAEHVMIVDLMRNDLGMIGSDVKVEKFRYIEKIQAGDKALLQVSSKITANLPPNWQDNLGMLLSKILPAGSISGTPKKSTVDIIHRTENYDRGFYTGIFGIYDNATVRSSVMIRFIEKENNKLFYKSGGGITVDSEAFSEYQELISKIYLPI